MKYQKARTTFSTSDDFVQVNKVTSTDQDEEDRLVFDDEQGTIHDSEPPQSKRRRFCVAIFLLIGFFLLVIIVVITGQATEEAMKKPTLSPTSATFIKSGEKTTPGQKMDVDTDDAYGPNDDDDPKPKEEEPDDDVEKEPEDDKGEAQVLVDEEEPEVDKDTSSGDSDKEEASDEGEDEGTTSNEPDLSHTIWALNLQRNISNPNTSPNLVFIKGMKVGGTSVAIGLNHAALTYKIHLAKVSYLINKNPNSRLITCDITHKGTLYFRHGYKNPWQRQCIPNVKYTTVLRDPVSSQLSFDIYTLNLDYFVNYPERNCAKPQFIDVHAQLSQAELERRLKTITTCNDTPYRRNLTMIYMASKIRSLKSAKDPGTAVSSTYRWITGVGNYEQLTAKRIINTLKKEYFLVGATERINQFLVLIALANGWDVSAVYYQRCKISSLDIPRREFEELFPALVAKLKEASAPAEEAYKWALKQFDEHVAKLGDWFHEKVKEYEVGLKKFQEEKMPETFKWKNFYYADGHLDVC